METDHDPDLAFASALDAQVELVDASLELMRTPPTNESQLADCVARLASARTELLGQSAASRGEELARRFQLSAHELAVVWLLASIASRQSCRTAAKLIAGEAGDDPTLRCIQLLVYGERPSIAASRELGAAGNLRRRLLVVRTDGGGSDQHESRCTWALAPRVLTWLLGDDSPDWELRPLFHRTAGTFTPGELQPDGARAKRSMVDRGEVAVIASGLQGSGRRTQLCRIAAELEWQSLEVDARNLERDIGHLRNQLRQIARECRLLGRIPLLMNVDALVDPGEGSTTRLDLVGSEIVSELGGPLLMTCGVNRPSMRWGRTTIVIDVKPPTSEHRAKLWLSELGQGTQDDAEYLATQYPLAPAMIHHAAKAAKACANGGKLAPEDIYAGVRAVLDDKLGDYAKRVEVTQTWDDLVVPKDQLEAVEYLIARIRQRRTVYEQWGFAAKVGKGLGTSALFSGPPGTGKTMVAALIAKELGLELYQVDMAKVVSKYIGETERNLAALFDAAEAGHAILLFDEADSLFGKRTEVKSSNDRYANLETNYLLQRLEAFTGICLLTSNHESNIDPAFQRRLSLHLRFELPEAEERAALWQAMLPSAAPVDERVDFGSLGRRFAMSGGYIRNAALRAAFLAADESSVITAAHLERAARLEYEGMGKIAADECRN
jgi:hypothetical protein